MRPKVISPFVVLLAIAWNTQAIASVGVIPRVRSEDSPCRAAVVLRVAAARVGTPAKPIPWWARGRVATQIEDAIADGLSQEAAYNRFYEQLSQIRNTWWRRDLAQAAAGLVENAPHVCEQSSPTNPAD